MCKCTIANLSSFAYSARQMLLCAAVLYSITPASSWKLEAAVALVCRKLTFYFRSNPFSKPSVHALWPSLTASEPSSRPSLAQLLACSTLLSPASHAAVVGDVGVEGRVRSSPWGRQRLWGKEEKAKTFSGCCKDVRGCAKGSWYK